MSLRFGENGGNRLIFHSDDLGAPLQALDYCQPRRRRARDGRRNAFRGGWEAHPARPCRGPGLPLLGAPSMARILALPSLTGFASTLSGSGLPFSTLRGDFTFGGGHLTLKRLPWHMASRSG